jgi:hypothetical protein
MERDNGHAELRRAPGASLRVTDALREEIACAIERRARWREQKAREFPATGEWSARAVEALDTAASFVRELQDDDPMLQNFVKLATILRDAGHDTAQLLPRESNAISRFFTSGTATRTIWDEGTYGLLLREVLIEILRSWRWAFRDGAVVPAKEFLAVA